MGKHKFKSKKVLALLLVCIMVLLGMCPDLCNVEGAYATTGQDIGMTTKSGTPITLFVYESNNLDQMTKEIIAPELTYSYDPENGYTIIFPDSKRNPAMRVETIDSDADKVSVSISYQNAMLTSRTITAELGMNKPKPDKFPSLQNLINLTKNPTKAQATLTVKQGEYTKDYPVTFIAKGTLGNGLSVSSGTERLRLAPEFEGKYTYKYDVYDASPQKDIVINATATIAKAEKTSYAYDGQEKKGFVNSFTIDKSVWNNRNKVDVQIIVEGGNQNPEVVPTTYTLTVWKKTDKLEIENAPNKTQYVWGDLFDKTGMKLKLKYSDGTEEYVDAFHITPEFGLTPDNNQVEISYGDKTVTQPIEVRNPFEGMGTKTDPYQVKKPEDLNIISQATQNGITFGNSLDKNFEETRKYFILMDDMELPANWVPIGAKETEDSEHKRVERAFLGVFYGNNKTITVPKGEKPLFGYVRADIKDLKVYGEQIEGYGLVNNYVIGTYANIDNVTLLSGSKTLKSGFIGGFASGSNTVRITNSKIDENVIIGYDGNESSIGSFAGEFNGVLSDCVSYATVKGKNVVGGLVGNKGQTMGLCEIRNSKFYGDVIASGECAGGIIGAGYVGTGWGLNTAPNTPCVSVRNCLSAGTVQGTDYVGGIIGAEPGVIQCWDNGIGYVQSNLFTGKIKTSNAKYVGGIIGYMRSLNKYNIIENNYFLENCGAKAVIGGVYLIDTNHKAPSKPDKIRYVNTANAVPSVEPIEGLGKLNHNREDDPLGFDADELGKSVTSSELENGTVTHLLNVGKGSFKNWIQSTNAPTQSDENILYDLEISGIESICYIGEELHKKNATIKGVMSDGSKVDVPLADVDFQGFESRSIGVKNVTVLHKNGIARTSFKVTVLAHSPKGIQVSFELLGDSSHGDPKDISDTHTLRGKNLTTWIPSESYTLDENKTVKDLLALVAQKHPVEFHYKSSNYIDYVTYSGSTIGEFTNGRNSGWMYTLNGTHPSLGVEEQFLKSGNKVVFHYTDDYTKEEGSDKWGVPGADEVKDVTTSGASGSATTTAPTEVKVSGTTATATIKAENQSEILKQAAEKKSAEIILEVSKADSKGADSVQLSLDVTFVKNVADKTNADLTVNTEHGRVTLDQETIKTVLAEAKGATITLEVTKVSKPTEVQKKAAGANGHLLKLTIKSGDKVISDFNKGKVKVVAEIVSKLLDKKVAAIHIADDGKIEQLAGKVLTIGGKKYYEFTTPHFSTFALVDADELGLEVAEEPTVDAKALTAKLTPIARSAKTAKKNVKVTVSLDKQDKAIVQELKDAGYTVKYRFYRSTKKAAGYKAAVTKKTSTYTNTGGKKGRKYFYKVQVRVYDENGKLTAKTALKQCKYASRTWTKGK